MDDDRDNLDALDALTQQQVHDYLHNRSMIHLEAAVGSLLDIHNPDAVADILRDYADDLLEYG